VSVRDLFGVAWHDVSLDDVRVFLEQAEDEPLLWEAKGTVAEPAHVRKAVGGFANSHEGGVLILGASQSRRKWDLDGVQVPDEPPTWVSSVVHAGVRPAPAIDVRSFSVGSGRHVVLVYVPPLADPPCVVRGTVYERVPGRTIPVKDPQRLQDLYARGERAHAAAFVRAKRVATYLLALDDDTPLRRHCRVAVGIAHLSVPQPAATDVLFSPAFSEQAMAVVRRHVRHPSVPLEGDVKGIRGQDAVIVNGGDPSERLMWRLRASWDGAVALGHVPCDPSREVLSFVREHIESAWREALSLAGVLGASGPHYAVVLLAGGQWAYKAHVDGASSHAAMVSRGPIASPDQLANEIESVSREVERIEGQHLSC
jgi:hypothetical protein